MCTSLSICIDVQCYTQNTYYYTLTYRIKKIFDSVKNEELREIAIRAVSHVIKIHHSMNRFLVFTFSV